MEAYMKKLILSLSLLSLILCNRAQATQMPAFVIDDTNAIKVENGQIFTVKANLKRTDLFREDWSLICPCELLIKEEFIPEENSKNAIKIWTFKAKHNGDTIKLSFRQDISFKAVFKGKEFWDGLTSYKDITITYQSVEKLTEFEREKMSLITNNWNTTTSLVEGYWASSPYPERDKYRGKYPFPIPHENPWPGQQQFLKKLAQLESSDKVEKSTMRGWAPSRLGYEGWDDHEYGSCEYWYKNDSRHIGWTDAFGPFYVAKRNVKPSHEFYDFVMNVIID